jgi:site-specific DNA recombinase
VVRLVYERYTVEHLSIANEETFAIAQELLTANKTHAPRRTIEPSICQGMVSCSKCGYALYRTSTRSSARKIHYYRCLGSDAWRYLNGPVCNNRPVRQDLLDQVVWTEIVKLLEAPRLIDDELNRRLEAAQNAAPTKRRQEALQRDLTRVRKSMERLMTAYQEDLVSLDELRSRMPDLRQREQAAHAELQSITTQAQDRASYLRLAETLAAFLGRLRSSAETLNILERQRIVRLLVKEILVADDAITIRHSIPVTANSPHNDEPPKSTKFGASKHAGYLLRPGRRNSALRSPELNLLAANNPPLPVAIPFLDWRLQPQLYQPQHRTIRNTTSYRLEQIVMRNRIEVPG